MKWPEFFESVDPFDEYCFQVRPLAYWLPESKEDEQERLQFNIWKYEQYLKNGTKFPRKINEQLARDYKRLDFLKKGLKLV